MRPGCCRDFFIRHENSHSREQYCFTFNRGIFMILPTLTYSLAAINMVLQSVNRCVNLSLITGSACGAIIYTLNLHHATLFRRLSTFLVSLFLGIGCSDGAAEWVNHSLEKVFSPAPVLNRTFVAALTAAVAVRLINTLSDLLFKMLNGKRNS